MRKAWVTWVTCLGHSTLVLEHLFSYRRGMWVALGPWRQGMQFQPAAVSAVKSAVLLVNRFNTNFDLQRESCRCYSGDPLLQTVNANGNHRKTDQGQAHVSVPTIGPTKISTIGEILKRNRTRCSWRISQPNASGWSLAIETIILGSLDHSWFWRWGKELSEEIYLPSELDIQAGWTPQNIVNAKVYLSNSTLYLVVNDMNLICRMK